MRKLIRLGAAVALAASGLVLATGPSEAAPVNVIDCDTSDGDGGAVPGGPPSNPGVTVPPTVPELGGEKIVGDEDPCAEFLRTLVFVGSAGITNGVNFNGTGDGTPGGDFLFEGQCVMVNWEDPAAGSSAPVDPLVTDCGFSPVPGEYHDPTNPNPIINPVFGAIADGSSENALRWAPGDQASCLNSSGTGAASFVSNSPVQAVGGQTEVWASDFGWEDDLDNLRGDVWLDDGNGVQDPGETAYDFDAKIHTNADPRAVLLDPLDATAAGCLQKPIQNLQNQPTDATTGLNTILVAGTASWRAVVPTNCCLAG